MRRLIKLKLQILRLKRMHSPIHSLLSAGDACAFSYKPPLNWLFNRSLVNYGIRNKHELEMVTFVWGEWVVRQNCTNTHTQTHGVNLLHICFGWIPSDDYNVINNNSKWLVFVTIVAANAYFYTNTATHLV